MKLTNKNNIRELSDIDKLNIYGGEPTPDTSFWYDVSWFTVASFIIMAPVRRATSMTAIAY